MLLAGDLVAKSPADGGLPPYRLDDLLGRPLTRALAPDEAIRMEDVAGPRAGVVTQPPAAAPTT